MVDPKIGDKNAFVFGRQLRSYYERFIWKTSSDSKENEVKDTLQGNEVSQFILQQLHTPIANGFKLACESGCVFFFKLISRSFMWRGYVGQSIHS